VGGALISASARAPPVAAIVARDQDDRHDRHRNHGDRDQCCPQTACHAANIGASGDFLRDIRRNSPRDLATEERSDRRLGPSLVLDLSPGEAQHLIPEELQSYIAPAVLLERRAAAVRLPTIDRGDETTRRPEKVDLESIDADVHLWLGKAVAPAEREEQRLELRACAGAFEEPCPSRTIPSSIGRPRNSVSRTAALNWAGDRSGRRSASVLRGLVTGIPSRRVHSDRYVDRSGSAALKWLRTASSPQASTAAVHLPCSLSLGCLTA